MSSFRRVIVAASGWVVVFGALLLGLSTATPGFQVLAASESNAVIGAAPECKFHKDAISNDCTDKNNTCRELNQQQCTNAVNCLGCTKKGTVETKCNSVTQPWTHTCEIKVYRPGDEEGSCGKQFVNPTCRFVNNQCECFSPGDTGKKCSRATQTPQNVKPKCDPVP
jgi:hypothetical protein